MKALNRTDDEFVLPLTPLLDVVFLLLVFFLVSTSFVKPEKSIDIKLPTAEQAERRIQKIQLDTAGQPHKVPFEPDDAAAADESNQLDS